MPPAEGSVALSGTPAVVKPTEEEPSLPAALKMAAPDELFCWEGDWGLPSVSTDCLVVLVSLCSQRTGSPAE